MKHGCLSRQDKSDLGVIAEKPGPMVFEDRLLVIGRIA